MVEQPIIMSDNYKSGFLIRIKKTNGKVNNVWLEISTHNSSLETTLSELNKLSHDMKLEGDIGTVQPPKPPEKLNVRYFCNTCKYNIPAFPEQPNVNTLFCPTCNKWTSFSKK